MQGELWMKLYSAILWEMSRVIYSITCGYMWSYFPCQHQEKMYLEFTVYKHLNLVTLNLCGPVFYFLISSDGIIF